MRAIYLTLLLSACTQHAPIALVSCPAVPECTRPSGAIETQADLVRAYQDTDHALQQCTVYRDTLAACLRDAHVQTD